MMMKQLMLILKKTLQTNLKNGRDACISVQSQEKYFEGN